MSLEQEAAIRELLARSSDCVWRKDGENYGLCYATDGEWRIIGQSFKGREAVKAAWSGFMSNLDRAWQTAHNIRIEVEGERAWGRLYLEEMVYNFDGSVYQIRGIYHDEFKVEDGRWVFARRHIDIFYSGPPSMVGGRRFAIPEYGPGVRLEDLNRPASPSAEEYTRP